MDQLYDKKLLVLGGTLSTYDVVKTAKEMGLQVIVTDYLESGVSKNIADKVEQISTDDIEKLAELIKEEEISGVFTGASEFNIRNMIRICERTNLPHYLSLEQWDIYSNKKKFKEECKKYDVPVVPEYDVNAWKKKAIEYPVIVKPVDSYSGHGITVCENEREMEAAIVKAKEWSKSKEVIIEKYVRGHNIEVYYLIQDGKAMLLTAADRYTNKEQHGSPVPTSFFHPSKYLDDYLDLVNPKVCSMFEKIGVKNGVFFMEAFLENDKFMFYEMGFRLNATMEYHFVEYFNGFSPLKMMIRYAVTGSMGASEEKKNNPYFEGKGCEIALLLRPGTICKVVGLDLIEKWKSVIHIIQFYREGDSIYETGSLDQNFARIKVVAKTDEELEVEIHKIYEQVSVIDEFGNDMLIRERR